MCSLRIKKLGGKLRTLYKQIEILMIPITIRAFYNIAKILKWVWLKNKLKWYIRYFKEDQVNN